MKLRTKLTLGAVLLLLAALTCVSVLYIRFSLHTLWEEERGKLRSECDALSQKTEAGLSGIDNSADDFVKGSAIRWFFTKAARKNDADTVCVLYGNGEAVCNNSGLNLPLLISGDKPEAVVKVSGNTYGISQCPLVLFHDPYTVYVVRNIGDLVGRARFLILSCIAVGCVAALLTSAGVYFFLKHALSPLETLEKSAGNIASGNYRERVEYEGNDEIGALTQSFNSMAASVERHIAEIEETAEKRKLLLSALAHEMRTPVTAISGYSYALKNARLTEEQKEEAIGFIDAESKRLERLSGKLTQLVGLGTGLPAFHDFSVPEWGEELRNRYRDTAGIEVRFPENGTLHGDPDLLTLLVTNLCENAKKAGADRILVSVSGTVLSVSDDGCGIPEEEIGRIFEPFYQSDPARKKDGFGLGLALCRKIAELHGAELTVESKVGEGSVFSLDLYNSFTVL